MKIKFNSLNMIYYLSKIGKKLEDMGITGEIILCGGASMCLIHGFKSFTEDIDAIYEPKHIIDEIIKQISSENNLPAYWLNDSVAVFLTDNYPIENVFHLGGLHIKTISAHYLLVMKLRAARDDKDLDDILFLMKKIKISTKEEAIQLIKSYFPGNNISSDTIHMIDYCIENL